MFEKDLKSWKSSRFQTGWGREGNNILPRDSKCVPFCLVIWYPRNVSEMATVKVHATLGKQSGLHWNLIEVNCVWNIWCRNKTPYVLWKRGAAYLALALSKHVCSLYQFEMIQAWLLPSSAPSPNQNYAGRAVLPAHGRMPSLLNHIWTWGAGIFAVLHPSKRTSLLMGIAFFINMILSLLEKSLLPPPPLCFCCYLIEYGSWCRLHILEVHSRAQPIGLLSLCAIHLSRQQGSVGSLTKQLYFIDRHGHELILHLN